GLELADETWEHVRRPAAGEPQATAALADRRGKADEALPHEPDPVRSGPAAGYQRVVDDEQRDHLIGLGDGRAQRRVVMEAEVAAEPDDRSGHTHPSDAAHPRTGPASSRR